MMISIIILACQIGTVDITPDKCSIHRHNFYDENMTTSKCFMISPMFLSEFIKERPNLEIKKWTCTDKIPYEEA